MTEFDQNQQQPAAAPPPEYQAPPPPPEYQAPPPPPAYQAPPPYQAPPQYGQPVYGAEKPTHTPSLILGIIAIVILWFTIGIGGVVCGIIGIILAKKAKDEYKTTIGFVLSLIGIIIGAIILLIAVVALVAFGAMGYSLLSYM